MIINDNKMKKAFRTNMKPSAETERLLLDALHQSSAERGNNKVHTSLTQDGKTSERGGRGLVLGLLAMAAVAVIAVIVIKLIPSLRSSSASNPGPNGDWEPAVETFVTGETDDPDETDLTIQAPYNTTAPDNESGGEEDIPRDENDSWSYELDDLIFTLPEIWRGKGVLVIQSEDRLTAVYRDITLCSLEIFSQDIMEYNTIETLQEMRTEFLAESWELDGGRTAALFVPNHALSISSAGCIRQYEPVSMRAVSYTEDEDLSDFLYMITGEELDAAKIKARSTEPEASADIQAAITAAQEFANTVLASSVRVNADYAYTYRLGALSFVMPEIWRAKGVEIIQEEHELKAMYRGLLLASIGEHASNSLVGGDPLNYCAGVWYLNNRIAAMLYVHNWPMKIGQGTMAVTYEGEGVMGTVYTSAEDLADILYVTTGKEYDIEELKKRIKSNAGEFSTEAVMDGRDFAFQVIAPSVSVDQEAYTFRTDYFTFTLPEPWRASPGNVPPLSGVNVIVEENELSVMYRGLRLCTIFVGDAPAADECLFTYTASAWVTGKDEQVSLKAEIWAQNILARGSIGPVYDENQSNNSFYYDSDYDLQDILYMITGKVWDIEEISEFKGQAENPDMSAVVQEVQNAATDFIIEQVVPMVDVHPDHYETDEYSFRMPTLWKEKGASFVMNQNGLHVVYRGLTLCLLRVAPAEQVYTEAANTEFIMAWEIGDGNAVIMYENITPVGDVWSHGWIHSDIDPVGPVAVFTSDEDMADILYMYTGQQIDVSTVKGLGGQLENLSANRSYGLLQSAAADFFNKFVVPALTVKTPDHSSKNYKTYYPSVQKSWYLKDLLHAEPYSYAGLPESVQDCQIPEEDLHALTNEELILTLLDYPYDDAIARPNTSYNPIGYWGDYRRQAFNGFRELTEREDRDEILRILNQCRDYIATEYGWIEPRNLLDYLDRLITYLGDHLDVPLPTLS